MNEEHDPKIDNVTKELLVKCEVSNLKEFYHKWLEHDDHVVPIKKISSFHDNFNQEKIINDVSNMNDFLIVSLYEYFRTKKGDKDIAKEQYLIDHVGLIKLIRSLKRRNFFNKRTPVKEIIDKLGLKDAPEEQKITVLTLLKKSTEDDKIYAELVPSQHPIDMISKSPSNDEKKTYNWLDFVIYNKLNNPMHKKTLIYLIITLSGIIITISVFLPLLTRINQG